MSNPTEWSHRAENKRLPLQQCDLKFENNDGNEWMQIWNYIIPEVERGFNGNDAYSFRVGNLTKTPGRIVDTSYPFYALGFDHGSKGQGNGFAIKVFDDEVRSYRSTQLNRAGAKAEFFGWISDTDYVDTFEIGGADWLPDGGVTHVMLTNIIFATRDEVRDAFLDSDETKMLN